MAHWLAMLTGFFAGWLRHLGFLPRCRFCKALGDHEISTELIEKLREGLIEMTPLWCYF
jgi:hypothetical protein